jgi:hypothetical protein
MLGSMLGLVDGLAVDLGGLGVFASVSVRDACLWRRAPCRITPLKGMNWIDRIAPPTGEASMHVIRTNLELPVQIIAPVMRPVFRQAFVISWTRGTRGIAPMWGKLRVSIAERLDQNRAIGRLSAHGVILSIQSMPANREMPDTQTGLRVARTRVTRGTRSNPPRPPRPIKKLDACLNTGAEGRRHELAQDKPAITASRLPRTARLTISPDEEANP